MKIKFGERIIISDSDKLTPRSEDEILKEIAIKGSYNFWVEPVEAFDNAVTEAIIKIAKERGIDEVVLLNKPAIISALEKQIPKKPTPHKVEVDKIKIGNTNWCKGTTVFRCPCCNEFISRTYTYCSECGQALEWGDK